MSKENILGTLVVVVLKAQHLIDNHTFYKQDPYAKLSLSGSTKHTPPDPKGGQHPVWDAELRFPISKDASKNNRTLTISVFSEEKKEDGLLGEGSVDITDTLKTGEFDDWVSLSLKGTQRGEVYLEMTFFATGPAPLTRRPTKFTSPTERLGRPQHPAITQQPPRVTSSQTPSSSLSPQAQQGPRINTQDVSRRRPSRGQQARLPGAWPGPSGHNQPLPAFPPEPEPKQEVVPSILRPGGPSRSGNTSPNAHPNTPPLSGSSVPHSRFSSASPSLEAQTLHSPRVSSYSGQGSPHIPASNGHSLTQPSPELPHLRHNLPSQPSPQQQQQTQHPASPPAPYASPYPPNNNPAAQTQTQTHVPHHAFTQAVSPYVTTQSPKPGPAPPPHSSQVPPPQQHAATLSPAPPAHYATSISAAPPSPPPHSYHVTPRPPAHSSAPQSYTTSPVPLTPYPALTSPHPQAQPYVSPIGPVLSYPAQTRLTPPSSPPLPQSYFSPPSSIYPLPNSPPPGPPYGHSYEPTPTVSFPMPQASTPDYFATGRPHSPPPPAPYAAPIVEPELPDPYLLKRYQTPLPLPPGSNHHHHYHHHQSSAQPKPPAAAASRSRQDESERAAREMQRREEDSARVVREQEERDAELARTLDLELNVDGSGGQRRPLLPPRHPQAVGGQRSGIPGAW